MKHILILLSLSLVFSSFSSINSENTESLSTVIFKLNYNSWGLRGFGGRLTVRNIETNEIYKRRTKKGFRPFIIIENLPVGEYEILELEIISGGPLIYIKDKNLFNVLRIEKPKNYYLGNYLTKKIKPILKLNIAISKKEKDPEFKIMKQLIAKSPKWLNLEIDYSKSLFKSDRTEVKITN